MNIVTTTSVFPFDTPAEQSLQRLAACGFSALDLAIDYLAMDTASPFHSDRWVSWAKRLREQAESLGVAYTHAHAPGNAATKTPTLDRAFELCRVLGVRYMVIHPVTHDENGVALQPEDFLRINRAQTLPLLEKAQRCGVILLSENLLWGASHRPACISALVSELASPYFGWCYDTGHAHLCGHAPEELLKLENAPLSLHLQDNCQKGDEHLFPGDGTLPWDPLWDVLHRIGYGGDYVLEAHHQTLEAPDQARDGMLCDLFARSVVWRDAFLERKRGV